MSLVEEQTLSTLDISPSDNTNFSAGNTSTAFEYECYEIEPTHLDSITMGHRLWFLNKNRPWPFVLLIQLVPCKVEDSFDYSLTQAQMSLWLRDQPYQKGVITKLLCYTKLVRTLAGCLKMQEVVTMWGMRLPEFNKKRHINQQKVLVFDNDNVKYDIILGTNFLSKTGLKLN